ncbi:MAG: chalcone isomerase family protein [Proteobacteria bacterium]|nr:chalcone isomerase family protein [Pseudomonadota bacterium]
MHCRIPLFLALFLASGTAAAADATCRDISFPRHVTLSGTDLTLNGLGVRKATFLKINVYVAAYYVTQPSHDSQSLIESDTPQQLTLQFVRSVGVDDLRKAFVEGFERVAVAGLQERVARLNAWMTDMKSGQRLTFARIPHAGVQISVNGVQKGVIEGADFSRALISIWLGQVPPNPELKTGLLGGDCG